MPLARARSRNRKNTVLSKKYWVSALVAPASIFAFNASRSASKDSELGVFFRVSRDGDFERGDRLDTRDEVCGIDVAVMRGNEAFVGSRYWIAAKSYDASYAKLPILAGNLVDLVTRCRDAGEMGRDVKRGLF